jgi:hypothetical protein
MSLYNPTTLYELNRDRHAELLRQAQTWHLLRHNTPDRRTASGWLLLSWWRALVSALGGALFARRTALST